MMRLLALFAMLFCLFGGVAHAADSACARVSIEIAQELTLERVAFEHPAGGAQQPDRQRSGKYPRRCLDCR